MEHLIAQIAKLEKEALEPVIKALIRRGGELYPDWEMHYFALQKNEDRSSQIAQLSALLSHEDKTADID